MPSKKRFKYQSDSESENEQQPVSFEPVPTAVTRAKVDKLKRTAVQQRQRQRAVDADRARSKNKRANVGDDGDGGDSDSDAADDRDDDGGGESGGVGEQQASGAHERVNYFAAALASALDAPLPRATPRITQLTLDERGELEENAVVDPILAGTRTAQQRNAQRLAKRRSASSDGLDRAQRLNRFHTKVPAIGEGERTLSKLACEGGAFCVRARSRAESTCGSQLCSCSTR